MRAPALIVLAAALCSAAPAQAQPAAARSPVAGPVTFGPREGTTLEIAGRGPYRGSLETRVSSASLSIVNELDLESYVMGLAEVPGSWPMEALKAQAVAARTYALWEKENGAWRKHNYDICATTTCQVYAGASVERGERGRRWVEAVKATRGEVLLHKGRPALTRYHASSGGETLSNEIVFPKQGKLPYLRGIRDSSDKVSPLHRWQVDFTRQALENVLRAGLKIEGPLEGIEVLSTERSVIIHADGIQTRVTSSRFRSVVSREAPKLFPDLYPGERPDGRRMPATLPSSRFTVEGTVEGYRVAGRGFGHGVGMSQWGARGRAERGEDYRRILAAYYGGLEPVQWKGPAGIRVGLRRSESVTIGGDGAFSVGAGADSLAQSTVGPWTVARATARTLRIGPPEGFELPLFLSGVEAPKKLKLAGEGPRRLDVSFVIPKAARIDAVLAGSGRIAAAHDVFAAGAGRLRIRLPDSIRSDGYKLSLTAYDGRRRTTKTLAVRVERPGGSPLVPVFLASLLLLAAAAVVLRNRRDVFTPPQLEMPTESRMKEYSNASSRHPS